MHAADVVETIPTARPDDEVLSAVRMVCRQGLPRLVVADERGDLVGCLSSIDLLRLVLPRYLQEDPGLARVVDEEHAEGIAAALAGTSVRDVIGTSVRDVIGGATNRVPWVRSRATVVEIAEQMVLRSCPIVLVTGDDGAMLGIVTANRLLGLLMDAAEAP
jgi:CBS-domain-containing membrane protein